MFFKIPGLFQDTFVFLQNSRTLQNNFFFQDFPGPWKTLMLVQHGLEIRNRSMAVVISDALLRSLPFGSSIVDSTFPRGPFHGLIPLEGVHLAIIRGGRMPDTRLLTEVRETERDMVLFVE